MHYYWTSLLAAACLVEISCGCGDVDAATNQEQLSLEKCLASLVQRLNSVGRNEVGVELTSGETAVIANYRDLLEDAGLTFISEEPISAYSIVMLSPGQATDTFKLEVTGYRGSVPTGIGDLDPRRVESDLGAQRIIGQAQDGTKEHHNQTNQTGFDVMLTVRADQSNRDMTSEEVMSEEVTSEEVTSEDVTSEVTPPNQVSTANQRRNIRGREPDAKNGSRRQLAPSDTDGEANLNPAIIGGVAGAGVAGVGAVLAGVLAARGSGSEFEERETERARRTIPAGEEDPRLHGMQEVNLASFMETMELSESGPEERLSPG